MELSGDLLIGAPRAKVWQALNDPGVLVHCIPGCEEVQRISPTETHTRVLLKMGPVRARFVGKILMTDILPDQGCTLNFEGSGGAAGFARGTSVVSLDGEGDQTRLRYSANASVGGKLGQIGGRMIDASAKQMADQFFSALQARLASVPGDEGTPTVALEGAHDAMAKVSATALPPVTATLAAPITATRAPMPPPMPSMLSEGTRVLWFCLGALSTGFGVWIASRLID